MTNKELQAENATLKARVAELEQKLELSEKIAKTLESAPAASASKSRVQAEAALELLKAGPVTTEQLKAINPKYPHDPVYFVRSVLKQAVVTHRSKDGNTSYSLQGALAPAAKEEGPAPKEEEQAVAA
jgi:hypothetical protein